MRTNRMHSIVLPAVLLLGLLTACGMPKAGESQPQSALVRYDHPIGISLPMAEGSTVSDRENRTLQVAVSRCIMGGFLI